MALKAVTLVVMHSFLFRKTSASVHRPAPQHGSCPADLLRLIQPFS